MTNIMLVEDHSLFRQALAMLLDGESDLRVVAQAGSLAEARTHAATLKNIIELAVVDFTLPDGEAIDLLKELRRSLPDTKIMVFTASVDPETATRALEAGADTTLHKTVGNAEILAAVRKLFDD